MIVFLIGFMGSGKTTIGKKLANKLKFDFIDLDAEIENDAQLSITNIVNQKGESYFRSIEQQKLVEVCAHKNLVLSCGGGTPCFNNNMELMNSTGLTLYLQLSPEALFSRLILSQEKRPLISNLNEAELLEFIKLKLKERETFYLKSNLIVNGLSINMHELTKTILTQIAQSE